ncbi:hypothetical protein CR513_16226, partial [Mucuna pruriens]
MKQLATSNLEFQQSMNSSNMQFQQNMSATIQDIKTQIGQLANIVSHLQSAGSNNLPSANASGNSEEWWRTVVTSTTITTAKKMLRP